MTPDFSTVVRQVVAKLVEGDYEGLETLTNSRRLTAKEIAQAIHDYGATLVMPPPTDFNELDIVEVENANARTWSVRHDLWAEGEGKSDLSLELTVRESAKAGYDIELDAIYVL